MSDAEGIESENNNCHCASKTQQPQSRGRNAHVTTVAPELLLMDEENSDEVYYIIITKALDQDGYYTRHDTDGCVVYPAGTTCIQYKPQGIYFAIVFRVTPLNTVSVCARVGHLLYCIHRYVL